ncbi:MAG: ribonuclease H family protein [Thermoflexales bacterium]|nr:ribonuclease H family protein [Thermoflexales bacterium]MDW8352034.1 ribonuclease H family protein [Anaerolineae bacterium]
MAKFYVVWQGRRPGVYESWSEARAQVEGFTGARYRSFASRAQAEAAFASGGAASNIAALPAKVRQGYAVDAAWSARSGQMEYRCVEIVTGREIFRGGPFEDATNNVGEFLAVVHALAWLKERGSRAPIYTDSSNAILWVAQARCQTTLARTPRNAALFERIAHAERWLDEHEYCNAVLKWRTDEWGENPADFGRK